MPQLTKHLTAFSLLLLAACAGVPRPDTDLCIINAPAKHLKCYNMARDYDESGQLLPSAKPTFRPASVIKDVNKYMAIDTKGLANLKTYINTLRDELSRRCQ